MRTAPAAILFVFGLTIVGLGASDTAQPASPTAKQVASPAAAGRVALTAGEAPTIRKGTVIGDRDVTYVVSGRKGQTLVVDMKTASTSLYFNVLPAGNPEALYASDRGETGNTASLTLPADGDYQVVVYLFRNAARRGNKAPFTIALSLK